MISELQVLLFARSGVGKTSLVNAGLLEELRKSDFFPVTARVTYNLEAGPVASVIERVDEEAVKIGVQVDGLPDLSTLWGYFSSVRFLKDGHALKPVLILDQFEELFTRSVRPRREEFIGNLADLATGRTPRALRDAALSQLDELPEHDPKREHLTNLAYGKVIVDVKILLALREDFLPEVNALKALMPNVFRNTLRLEPLRRAQAEEAIVKPTQRVQLLGEAFTFEPGVVKEILNFLCGQQVFGTALHTDDVEPVQLQILRRSLFERVRNEKRHQVTMRVSRWHEGNGSHHPAILFQRLESFLRILHEAGTFGDGGRI